MDDLRRSLHGRLDTLLDEVFEKQDHTDDAHLQITASILNGQKPDDLRHQNTDEITVLDCFNINEWKRLDSTQRSQGIGSQTLPSPTSVGAPNTGLDDSQCHSLNVGGDTERLEYSADTQSSSRKATGGLRLGGREIDAKAIMGTPPRTPSPPTVRRLDVEDRQFPKRRKLEKDGPAKLEQSTVDKLIEGIWEQIHRPDSLALGQDLENTFEAVVQRLKDDSTRMSRDVTLEDASECCRQITTSSRTNRALEVIVQAHWVDCYDRRLTMVGDTRTDLKTYEIRKLVMAEACSHFKWSEKELRNRVAIWKGYREIKNAAGWSALVFAGPGIYRFCKYRLGFDQEALSKLQALRLRLEVAADTRQPKWRQLLSLVGEPTQIHWRGHPHDWVVSKRKDPVPLASTYRQWDANFSFQHLQESIIDTEKWPDQDPRRSSNGPNYTCTTCSQRQSMSAEQNECECFSDLFGPNLRSTQPVQIFRTENGRNNGLIACCTFARGAAIGEFVGLVTKGLSNQDVMQSQVARTTDASQNEPYQIYQGQHGNFTRFINHSCQPNSQFQTFTWLGIQRILVISKGVPAGKEITVDYSGRYWQHLDKECLCGEPRCRYSNSPRTVGQARSANPRPL